MCIHWSWAEHIHYWEGQEKTHSPLVDVDLGWCPCKWDAQDGFSTMVVDWNSEEESGLLRDHLSTTWRANSHRWPSPKQNHYGLQSSNAIAELHQQQLIFHLMLGIRLHQIHHKSCMACLNIYGITKVWKRSWYFDKRPRGTEWLVDRKKFAMAFMSMCIGAPCNMGTLCDEYTVWCRPHKYWYSNQCSFSSSGGEASDEIECPCSGRSWWCGTTLEKGWCTSVWFQSN